MIERKYNFQLDIFNLYLKDFIKRYIYRERVFMNMERKIIKERGRLS